MTRLLTAVVVALLPTVAFAFTDNPRAASADYLNGPCTRVNDGPNGDVIQCTSAGGAFFIHRTFPWEATTGAVNVELYRYTPDNFPVGNVCDMVCIGVVRDGQRLDDINLSACTALFNVDVTAAVSDRLHVTNMLSIIPKDVSGTLCGVCPGPNCCAGAEEVIDVLRFDSGSCNSTQSTNKLNYRSVTLGYQ